MKEAIKDFIGRVPLQKWANRQFQSYENPELGIRELQSSVLQRIKSCVSGSALDRHYQVSAQASIEDYRRNIPIMDYDDLKPFIELAMAGDVQALYARHVKLQVFSVSSGTSGPRKFIPINNKVIAELKRSWKLWGTHLYCDHPDLLDCPITQITSSGLAGKTSGGIPFGDLSGFLAEIQPWYVSRYYAVPAFASRIADQRLKYYIFLRFALANRDLRIMTTASPATLLRIADLAAQEQATLIKDFMDGGVSISGVRDSLPKLVAEALATPDPITGRLLEELSSRGRFEPRHIWPKLKLLTCWTGGTMGHFKPILQDRYGEVSFRDIGLSSSEAHVTIPFADNRDDGLLNLQSNFYEFVDIDAGGDPLLADELVPGKSYDLIISTLGGLLRYQTNDRVICTGHLGNWPLLGFQNKGEYICDLTGEKLSACHVSTAVAQVCLKSGVRIAPFVVIPDDSFPRRYRLVVEDGGLSEMQLRSSFLPDLDRELGNANFIYREHREAEKLAEPALQMVPAGFLRDWHNERLKESGGSVEQYKPPCLITNANSYHLRVS